MATVRDWHRQLIARRAYCRQQARRCLLTAAVTFAGACLFRWAYSQPAWSIQKELEPALLRTDEWAPAAILAIALIQVGLAIAWRSRSRDLERRITAGGDDRRPFA